MEEIIKQIEALKVVLTTQQSKEMSVSEYEAVAIKNNTIDEVIEILKAQKVIKAKALRKKGTDEWYANDNHGKWEESNGVTFNVYFDAESLDDFRNPPQDAELIEIEILIK